jgi:hypothetical protein
MRYSSLIPERRRSGRGLRCVPRLALNALVVLACCVGGAATAQAQIHVTSARIGCLDIQKSGNLTSLVQKRCDGKMTCSYKAPTPAAYGKAGVRAATRAACSQAMEIIYSCKGGGSQHVSVEGDAWNHPAAQLVCRAPIVQPSQPKNPALVPVLNGLVKRYERCIIERFETPKTSHLPARDSATCADGRTCRLTSRGEAYHRLQQLAANGDANGFEALLKSAVLDDCMEFAEQRTWRTKHTHCTMKCGGNNGPIAGPCFETCKAGVDISKFDITAFLRDVAAEIAKHSALFAGNFTGDVAADPKMIAGNRHVVDPDADRSITETCDAPGLTPAVPPGHYVPPAALVDGARQTFNNPPGKNIGSSEGRLRKELRDAAARADPLDSLRAAAAALAAGDKTLGNAYADLAVTGRRSLARFRSAPPSEATIVDAARRMGATANAAALEVGARDALNRAYRVAYVVRAGGAIQRAERAALGYIAVSGEDDKPAWPVNVPSTAFPQYELVVDVKTRRGETIAVRTRFMIAESKPSARTVIADPGPRALPTEPKPTLGDDAEILLYVHGMDSRLEEAVQMAHALHQLAKPGKNYVMISMDLPTNGYAEAIWHTSISPLSALGTAKQTPLPILTPPVQLPIPGVPPIQLPVIVPDFDAHGRHDVPVLDFIEDFIVEFVEKLERTVPVKTKIRAVIGGSLGGNMALRLGRRGTPWIKNVVSWSPASIWDSLADGADLFKHNVVRVGWDRAGGDRSLVKEDPARRREFFDQAFERMHFAGINLAPAQPEMWWRHSWLCYPSAAVGARLERQEIYDHRFRLWHWRLGAEQLLFSHQTRAPDGKPLFRSNKVPMLLGCGIDDEFPFTNICSTTQKTAAQMIDTPGKARFLKNTGHSIHNERPVYWTREIVRFLGM